LRVPAARFAAFPILAIVFLAAAHCAAFVYFVESAPIRVPVYDLLDWLRFYGERMEAGDWAGYLWTPHNEHRIVISRTLLLIDARFLDGQGSAFALSGALLLAGIAAAVSMLVWSGAGSTRFRPAALSLALMLSMPAYIATTISMPAMGVFLHTSAFALFSLLLIDAEPGYARRFAAILAACIASFGVSGGLLVWPAMAWLSWRRSQGVVWQDPFWIVLIACGAGFGVFYLHGAAPSLHASAIGVAQISDVLEYAIRFLGLPWSHMHALVWPSRAVGLTLLSAGSYLVVRDTLMRPKILRMQRIGLALLVFVLLVAFAAGAARSDIATDREMPIRYAAFVGLGHLGLLLYLLPGLERLWNGAARPWIEAAAVCIAGALLAQQLAAGLSLRQEAARYNDAWDRFLQGEWTADMTHYVYPEAGRARETVAWLREHSIRWTGLAPGK
jgi:hypothetical protein